MLCLAKVSLFSTVIERGNLLSMCKWEKTEFISVEHLDLGCMERTEEGNDREKKRILFLRGV